MKTANEYIKTVIIANRKLLLLLIVIEKGKNKYRNKERQKKWLALKKVVSAFYRSRVQISTLTGYPD
jgi:hypothetical protein